MIETTTDGDWQKLSGTISDDLVDTMEDVLLGLGVAGVQTINSDFLPPDEGDPPPPGKSRLEFYLPLEPETPDSLLARVVSAWNVVLTINGFVQTDAPLVRTPLVNNDWATRWRDFFHPQKISERIWIAPSWEPVTPNDGELVIEIDPGMAFGTGTHETTSLVLDALDEMQQNGELPARVLDVGTGSGILSVAAYKLGARDIAAMDNDPIAVSVAAENLRHNGVPEACCTPVATPLADFDGSYPLVIANIISSILLMLKPHLLRLTAPGGRLLLSGILETEADSVQRVFEEAGLATVARKQKGEWVRLLFAKTR